MAPVQSLLACVVASAAGTAWAEVVPWLYDVDVVVASQGDAERRRAAGVAFTEVLGRVTGLRELPFTAGVDAAIREPDRYYSRYGYARHGFATRELGGDEAGDAVSETRLEIHFEPNPVLELTRRTGLPVWSADRPSVLAWVVLERDAIREVISSAPAGIAEEVAATMRREAIRRGVLLTFPLMDLQDRGLRVTDLWGRFWSAIVPASARYSRDIVLLGRMAADPGGGWSSRWEAMAPSGDKELAASFEHGGGTAAVAAGQAVHRLADALARRFAVRGGLDTIAVTVRGAQTVRGYAAVLSYLQSREYVAHVDVGAVDRDALHLRLHSRSTRDQLVELLVMGGYLSVTRNASPRSLLAASRLELTWMGAR